MDYSIIIPVFNKAAFTKRCLDALPATLAGAGTGEVIVVDNASSDETPQLLAQYPWIKLIRNEENRGFAGANNQGAAIAQGEFLVLLNNDTEPFPGWLEAMLARAREPGVGIVGAKLLFADRTIQHGGVVISGMLLSRISISPFHHNYMLPSDDAEANLPNDFEAITGACLLTPRALYNELGGLDEAYWNGYEDVDYCFKVRKRGLRLIYEPKATLFHFESQSGVQRFRKAQWNIELLEQRWRGSIKFDAIVKNLRRGFIRRSSREPRGGMNWQIIPTPRIIAIVTGAMPADRNAFVASLQANQAPLDRVVWLEDGSIAEARAAMEVRGNRYALFVRGDARLAPGAIDDLIGQLEESANCAAATSIPELPKAHNVRPVAADARCTLLKLNAYPQHHRLGDFDTIDGSVADFIVRGVSELRVGARGASEALVHVASAGSDASFERVHGAPLSAFLTEDAARVEALIRARAPRPRGLVSIVTLSWNAHYFTDLALKSIAAHTGGDYEVIVVDNGSGPDTIAYLKTIDDPRVRVIYNGTNLGFGGGNNVGIAAATGDYIVVLNNDVIVTDGWLDRLLGAFDRIPGLGMSAPRSNKIVGNQMTPDAKYDDEAGVHAYAAQRARLWKDSGYITDRAIGFCLCIDRRVIDEIGGFDERFVLGNFEDDDLCIRVRAAGYKIYVCDDSFIHHFGSQSFIANKVDYRATMAGNWERFAQKWGYHGVKVEETGYDPRAAAAGGFDREKHFFALPAVALEAPAVRDSESPPPRITFYSVVGSEADWQPVSEFARRYVRAFGPADAVVFAVGATNDMAAPALGKRLERAVVKAGAQAATCANIDVYDVDDQQQWLAQLQGDRRVDIATIDDRSPSALKRLVESVHVPA